MEGGRVGGREVGMEGGREGKRGRKGRKEGAQACLFAFLNIVTDKVSIMVYTQHFTSSPSQGSYM